MRKVEPSNGLVDGTVPAGLSFGVHKDGTVGIGSYSLSPNDFKRMVESVVADPRFPGYAHPQIEEAEEEASSPEPQFPLAKDDRSPVPKRTRKAKDAQDAGHEQE